MSKVYKQYYRRNLPHVHSPRGTLFITFRLEGSIAKTVINLWRIETEEALRSGKELPKHHRRWFAKFEDALHACDRGPTWLRDPRIAKLVVDALWESSKTKFTIHAYCVMPNHVHLLITPLFDERSLIETRDENGRVQFLTDVPILPSIMKSLKGSTARKANLVLGRSGKFWQAESYDHAVRDQDEFYRIKRYILNNPVKAGLAKESGEWPWSWPT